MTQFINRTDIRPGDTIRVTRDIKVEGVFPHVLGGSTQIVHNGSRTDPVVLDDSAQIELVKRPLSLPTKLGSFVEVTMPPYGKGDDHRVGHWLLTEQGGVVRWVSATRVHKTPADFETFLSSRGVQFEVVR